ncbi:MAG: bifunctional protein-serine/threonine kinase/phosphatase [Epsilonproteobacteria bacterium]|nr:bifunctional protein-serine/threonine kinase/phosphatase [Campylobacterota bacterium]
MRNQLKISIAQYSTPGRKEINQDFHDICIPKEPQLTNKGIAIALADGISSSDVSQIASKVSVTSFLIDYFSTPESWSVKKSAERVLSATNSWLYSQSKQGQYHYDKDRGYVCTFSGMIIRSSTAHIFHAGDTRIYRLRDNRLEQLTEDHRLWISRDKSYLSRALGMDTQVATDYESFSVEKNDIFLFMTDGVYEFVSSGFIIQTLQEESHPFESMAKIISDKAYDEGSNDNLTIQIVRIDDLPHKDIDEIHKQLTHKPFPPILEPRDSFDGYTIIRILSSSSRSHVYLARDDETGTSVVLKTPSINLRDDKTYLERFLMEEWIAIRINSPHVAKSYLQTRKRNYLYTVTEFIEGQTLKQWMIDNPKPTIETVRKIAEQIARGLLAFHRQEMIHQDLRPENIIIDNSGTVKIIDFGSTRVEGIVDVNTYLDQENLLGTALYSAPEYFLGKIGTSRSDLFSLGVIVYQMLSGEFPYGVQVARCTTKAAQKKLKYASLESEDSKIPVWIDEALKKALQPDPYERYGELSEFLYDLRHPNSAFINRTRPPLIERHPVVIWKGISFILFGIILLLLNR